MNPMMHQRIQRPQQQQAGPVKPVTTKTGGTSRTFGADITNRTQQMRPADSKLKKPAGGIAQTFSKPNPPTLPTRTATGFLATSTPQMEAFLDNDSDIFAGLSLDEETKEPEDPNQMAPEYIEDIMEYFKATESRRLPSPAYMAKQQEISQKMREILVDWLIEVHWKFKLSHETLFLAVNYLDRFLERRAVGKKKLQLVGCSALLLASKYEEIYPPEIQDFVYISDQACSRQEILAMEQIMLATLKFNLTIPTSLRFVERYSKMGTDNQNDKAFFHLSNYLVELTLQRYGFLRFLPSQISASAVLLARLAMGQTSWTAKLTKTTGYTPQLLQNTIAAMCDAAYSTSKHRAVQKKYSRSEFSGVARIKIKAPTAAELSPLL